jgi:hypothetical protein
VVESAGPCLGSQQHRRDDGGRSLSKFSQLCWDPRPSRSTLLRATATLVLLDEPRERLGSGHSGELLIAWISLAVGLGGGRTGVFASAVSIGLDGTRIVVIFPTT